ncbi:hypothetical protein VE03_01709 [Pseudogymnoascus sp. 23342-1-I1]|nr:hypothetical protein VE03_01709 [Pseudogymnoascus sp. 23342-1-I1]
MSPVMDAERKAAWEKVMLVTNSQESRDIKTAATTNATTRWPQQQESHDSKSATTARKPRQQERQQEQGWYRIRCRSASVGHTPGAAPGGSVGRRIVAAAAGLVDPAA